MIQIRKRRRLAPAAPAPRCTAPCACDPRHSDPYSNATSDTASAGSATTAPAAATTTASAEATASPEASTSAATTTSTAAASQLHAGGGVFFVVEEMESGEADVGEFLFIEGDREAKSWNRSLLEVAGRYSRCCCAPRYRKSQSGDSERRDGGFHYSLLLFRSLLHPLHSRILQHCRKHLSESYPTLSK
jgi:hypothetical protein